MGAIVLTLQKKDLIKSHHISLNISKDGEFMSYNNSELLHI